VCFRYTASWTRDPLGRKGIWALRAAFIHEIGSIFFAYWLDILGGLSSGLVESLCYVRAVVRDSHFLEVRLHVDLPYSPSWSYLGCGLRGR